MVTDAEAAMFAEDAFALVERIQDAMAKWRITPSMESSAVLLLLSAQSWIVLGADREQFRKLVMEAAIVLRRLRAPTSEFDRVHRDDYDLAVEHLRALASTNRPLRLRIILAMRSSGIRFEAATPPCMLLASLVLQVRAGLPEEIVMGTGRSRLRSGGGRAA